MSRELLLALDLGTTSVRALLVDAGGRVLARASRLLGARFPGPGRVEQDPRELWESSLGVLREALASGRRGAGEVAGLGIATQRAGALAGDAASGEPLAPMLGWQDGRAAPRGEELRAAGLPFTTLPSATRFEWLLRHQPEVREAAAAGHLRLGGADAWLGFRLSGGRLHVTDPGQASCTGLYDYKRGGWSEPACRLFGLDPGWLPRIAGSGEVAGETELLGAPVALGARAGDQQAACFGQGVLAAGDAKLTLGTAAMLDLHTGAAPAPAAKGAFPLALWRLRGEDSFCLEGSVITAGAAVDWLVSWACSRARRRSTRSRRARRLTGRRVSSPPCSGSDAASRRRRARPAGRPHARHTRAEIALAVLDGVAQRCGTSARRRRADAAAARGRRARAQPRAAPAAADLSGRPVLRAAETEVTALGAALLAGLAAGVFASPEQAHGLLAPPERFEPGWSEEVCGAARARWQETVARARS